jgi:hypothetical protein
MASASSDVRAPARPQQSSSPSLLRTMPVIVAADSNAPGAGAATTVASLLDAAQASGIGVIRTWAFSVNPNFPLQTGPNVYDNNASPLSLR